MNTMTDMGEQLDVKLLLNTLMALKKGDFSVRMPSDWTGVSGKIADTLNDIIETKQKMVETVTEVSRVVGREGHLTQRADLPGVVGGWSTIISSVNTLIDDLVRPTTEMARVIGAVAKGDLSQTMALEVDGHPLKGQYLRAAMTANTMVEQLSSFSSEVTRVAREVGTEGKLGGQAQVKGVAGTWKDLTDSVNSMAGNLTSQVRNIAEVTTAVANGDLSKKITVDVRGEILQLKDTINVMVDQLRSFASEVTRVTSEANEFSWSTIVLMVFLSSRISPFTSTVILRDKSPLATAIVTSEMLRTCPVRFDAIEFTLSVRSFHTPDTSFTSA